MLTMESFLPSEIARLVLGYLDDHKCEAAYEMFLKTSPLLDECLKMREEGRKFRTQVLGLNLSDILYEYSAIHSLVQERLKKVDPETADSLKHSGSLLDKITFLLNATSSGQTMLFSITLPPGKSPSTVAHVRKRLRTTSNSDKKKDYLKKHFRTHNGEFSPIHESNENDKQSPNLETTSLSSLPGNSNINILREHVEGTDIVRTPKRKNHPINCRRSRSNSLAREEPEENLDLTALTKAFLDNHELHEKIAENINKVICTPDLNVNTNVSESQDLCSAQNLSASESNTISSNNFTVELDNAIKRIVQDTESDPIFENFLHEIIDPAEESSDKEDERAISDTSTPCQSTPETNEKSLPLKQRLRNSKTKQDKLSISSELDTPDQIDHQNAAAIECIISMTAENKTSEQPAVNAVAIEKSNLIEQRELHNVPRNNNENQLIIGVPEPEPEQEQELSIETSNASQPLTVDTAPSAVTASQNVMINNQNANLLMIGQQNAVPPPSTIVITEPPFTSMYQQPLITDNRFILLSGNKLTSIGSQFLTVQPTQFQLSQPATILNDRDLLTMPTVLMCDEQQSSNTYVIPQTVYPAAKQTVTKRKGPIKIMPKSTAGINNLLAQEQQNIKTENVSVQETDTVKYTISVQAEPIINSNAKPSTSKAVEETCGPSVPMISLSSGKKDNPLSIEKIVTPDKSDSKIQMSLSTPRNSRSHIRALDFSTPSKENLTVRKAYTSPKSVQGGKIGKLSRHSRSSLFTSPLNLPIATRSPHEKLQGDWDNSELIFGVNTSSTKQIEEDKVENKKSIKQRRAVVKKRESLVGSEMKDPLDIGREETKEKTSVAGKNKKFNSWDQDLRLHIASMQTIPKKNKAPNKRNNKRNAKKINNKEDCSDKNKIEEESIESELAKMEGIDTSKEDANKKDNSKTNKKPVKVMRSKRKRRKIAEKTELNVKEEPVHLKEEKEDSKETSMSEDNNVEQNKEVVTEGIRYTKNRLKKKCNVINTITNTNQEANNTKSCDFETEANTNEIKSLTILSPPITNVNKRNLIEYMTDKQELTENLETKLVNESVNPVEAQASTSKDDKTENNVDRVTPIMLKPSCSNVITAKINLTPVLETPVKFDSLLYPNTPNICTSFGTDASITKLLQQNCGSLDLSSIMTPNFPITPSFPMTPNIQTGDSQSSYASRPTDYSNSSSYYQPSDSEQNQKFEQVLIEECKKIDSSSLRNKNVYTSMPDKVLGDQINELSVPPKDSLQGNNNPLYNTVIENKLETENNSSKTTNINNTSFSSNSESDISHQDVTIKESDVTIIHINPRQTRRSGKHMATLEKLVKTENNSDTNKSEDGEDEAPKQPVKITLLKKQVEKDKGLSNTNARRKFKSNVTKSQNNLLQELEIKRKRTISELKQDVQKAKPQRKPRTKNVLVSRKIAVVTRAKGKLDKNKNDNKEEFGNKTNKSPEISPPKNKSTTPKKSIESVAARLRKDKNSCKSNDKDLNSLYVSVEEDNDIQNKLKDLFSPNTSIESNDGNVKRANEKSMLSDSEMVCNDEDILRLHISSDEDTNDSSSFLSKNDPANLIKTLKERGIHLIPKKAADKKLEDTGIVHDEDNPAVINSQKLNLQISNFDIEDNIPQNRIERFKSKHEIESDKIEIKSDIYLDKSKIIDVSKIGLSHSVVTDTIFGTSIKTTEIIDKTASLEQVEKKTNSLEINNAAMLANTSISSDCSEFDLEFHVKIITEDSPEYIKLSYDELIPTKKTLSNYNFALLDKQITAKVFLEELNIEQDRLLSVTPFIELLTLPPPPLIPKLVLKPLSILYDELVDDSSVDTVTFEESNDFNRKKLNKIKIRLKSPKPTTVKAKTPKTDKTKKKISIEQYKKKKLIKKDDVSVEDKFILNSEEDALMTFAVTGVDKSLEKKDVNIKKRKASDTEKQNSEKRIKTNDKHALLKNIDVDIFLSMVHGPSNDVT